MKIIAGSKFNVSGLTFIIVSALFITLFQNPLFLSKSWQIIQSDSLHDLLFSASIPLLLFVLLNIIFSVLLWPWIRKPLMIAFLLIGAAVNYFMYSFNIVIDANMVENALETNLHESMDLVTFKLLGWLLVLGIIPAFWVIKCRISSDKGLWRAGLHRLINVVVSLLVIVLIGLFFYKDYASLLRNNRFLMKTLVPSNAILGVVKVVNQRIDANRPFIDIGTDARKGAFLKNQPKKTLAIVVVGETARGENFSLGGYPRQTNPLLGARKDVIYFDHVSSCGTATAVSVPCMFSNMTRQNYDATVARHQSGLLDMLTKAGVNVLWRENDGGCKGVCDRVPTEDMTELNLSQYCKDGSCKDGILLHQLDRYIDQLNDDGIIVLHQMGSHGPSYYQRYPDEYRKFTPDCQTNSIQDCDQQTLVNTYDNTLVYTDAVLNSVIQLLERYQDKFSTVMIYLSDHGESLGENGLYLHGTPYALAPSQQTHVPFLVWMSPDYKKNHQIDADCLDKEAKQADFSHDNLFHSLLGVFDIQSSEYQSGLDLFKPCRSRNAQ
jgi:lipid A ethanolaminephosphotransferase